MSRQPIVDMDVDCRRPRHDEILITFRRKFTSGDLTSRHVYRMLREFVDFANVFN